MTIEDLIELYEEKKKKYGKEAYKYISELLKEAKKIHRKDWLKNPTPNRDHEQSWRAFKGKNLEKVVEYIITKEVEALGLRVINGEEKIEFTGMESRRRDWTDLAKKFQQELLNKIFHKEEISVYVKSFIDDVKNGKYDDLLIYRKSIRKSLEKYTKTTPPHVKAARKLKKVGSSVIEYVITEDGPEPIQNKKHKIDYNHYINKQLKPIADSILIFYNKKFDDLIKGSRQVSLFNF